MIVQFRLQSPLAHGSFGQSAGNATLIRRAPLVGLPGMPSIPVVSGNALRGVMRRLVMRELMAKAGMSRANVAPGAWDRLYAAIVNGGHLDGSETSVNPSDIRSIREALPPLSVFGAALYTWMLPGHMSVGWLWPRCAETVAARVVQPGLETVAAEDLVHEVSLCRHVEKEHQDPEVSGVTAMPTTIETLATGSVLECSVQFAAHATPIERACIAHALRSVTVLGGKSGGGMGAVEMDAGPSEQDAAPYTAWLSETADLATRLARLASQIEAKPKKVPKGKAAVE